VDVAVLAVAANTGVAAISRTCRSSGCFCLTAAKLLPELVEEITHLWRV
jgi:hypothetical protein